MKRTMPRASLRLLSAWACLVQAPLLLGGFAQDLPGPATEPALSLPFAAVLVLAAAVPVLWAALGAGRDAESEDAGPAVWREALLLAAVAAPALSLAWPTSGVDPASAAAALGYVGAWWAAVAAVVTWGPAGSRLTAVVVALVLTCALPVWIVVWRDMLGELPPLLPWLSPTWATAELLTGVSWAPPVGCLAVGVAVALAGPRLARAATRHGGRPLAGATALALACAWAPAQGEPVRPLLGDRVRPGEPYPLLVDGTQASASESVAARSFATRYAAPGGAPAVLAATPLGGGYRLTVEAGGPADWRPATVTLPEPIPVRDRQLLVGLLGSGARGLADRLGLEGELVALEPAKLRALALAGEALDVVVASAGAGADPTHAAYLRAWVAAGGVLACDDPADAARVLPGVGVARPPTGGARVHALGAGWVVQPMVETPWSAEPGWRPQAELTPLLRLRLRERARRRALEQSLLEAPPPGPSPARGRRLAGAALGLAVALLLLLRLAARLDPARVAGAGLSTGLGLALLLQWVLAPPSPVLAEVTRIVEVPLGGRVARRLELVRASAPRRVPAQLTLPARHGAGPPHPRFLSQVTAVGARLQIDATPSGPSLTFPAGPTPRAFLRHDAFPLPAPLTSLDFPRDDEWALLDLVRVDSDGVHTPTGVEPLARWTVAGRDPTDRRWRRLAAAGLSGFDRRHTSIWLGRLGPGPAPVTGAAEARQPPGLLIVPAYGE